jgi:hypothetical protein
MSVCKYRAFIFLDQPPPWVSRTISVPIVLVKHTAHMSMSMAVSMDTATDTWKHGHMDMIYGHVDIWTFRHLDTRTCCRDAGHDSIHKSVLTIWLIYIRNNVLKTLTENVQNINNMGNLPVFLNVYSLKTFCHIRRFVLISFVSVDVLSVYVLSYYALCLFSSSVHIRFVTLYILSLYLLSLYILSFRCFVIIRFVTESSYHI